MYLGRAGAADRCANGGCEADRCGGRSYGRANYRRCANYGGLRADHGRGADDGGCADSRGGSQTCDR